VGGVKGLVTGKEQRDAKELKDQSESEASLMRRPEKQNIMS